ncbi:hypothetical protein [Ovoidimarina sediminis]|nr:hypothetical protein [Rhodophyticola sp. MJ-SS7]MDU8945016.1 hypothetical protein [Rhodophyticola sp. MJ-SS7]
MTRTRLDDIRQRPDGSIDLDYYLARGRVARAGAAADLAKRVLGLRH